MIPSGQTHGCTGTIYCGFNKQGKVEQSAVMPVLHSSAVKGLCSTETLLHSPMSSFLISFSLSTVSFFSSKRFSTTGLRLGNCRRGWAESHSRLSITLHRVSSRRVISGQRFLKAISNKALTIRAAFCGRQREKHQPEVPHYTEQPVGTSLSIVHHV